LAVYFAFMRPRPRYAWGMPARGIAGRNFRAST